MNLPKFNKAISKTIIILSFGTLWAFLYTPILDGDLWFHLLYGQQIIANKSLLLDHSAFSWTPTETDAIYCCWIPQLFYFVIVSTVGYSGIIILRYLLVSVFFISIFITAKHYRTQNNPLVWLSAVLCILVLPVATLDKPEMFSLAFLSLTVAIWYIFKSSPTKSYKYLYLLPCIMLAWVNCHGVFLFGCILLFIVGVGETLNIILYPKLALPKKTYLHLCVALLLSALTIFITPYGYEYIVQLITSLSDQQAAQNNANVIAYTPTFDRYGYNMHIFAYGSIILLILTFIPAIRKKQLDFTPILINIVFAFIFTMYSRSTYIWAPIIALTIAAYSHNIGFKKKYYKTFFIVSTGGLVITLSIWILYQEKCTPSRERWLDFGFSEFAVIKEEASFIKKHFPHARLGNSYDHGAYLAWELWPKQKVMLDARAFPYQNWLHEYFQFYHGQSIEKFVDSYPFDIIEVGHTPPLVHWFWHSKEWNLVFLGKGAAIFAKASIAPQTPYERGKNINRIYSYKAALNFISTATIIRDWDSAQAVLSNMRLRFQCKEQLQRITGLEHSTLAAKLYYENNYSGAVAEMKSAMSHKVIDKDIYAASLLQKAIIDWHSSKYKEAVASVIESLRYRSSFAAHYNIALMAWQIERMPTIRSEILSTINKKDLEPFLRWKMLMEEMISEREKFGKSNMIYIDNVDDILNNQRANKDLFSTISL